MAVGQKLKTANVRTQKLVSWMLTSSIILSHGQILAQSNTSTVPSANSNATTQSRETPVTLSSISIQNTLSSRSLLKAGSTVFETAEMIQLYGQRDFQPIWINNWNNDLQPTAFVEAYKVMVQSLSLKHGLIASDYWTPEVEAYLAGLNSTNAIAAEMLLSQLYLRLAQHLSDGRIEPTVIDNDVRFKKRVFTSYKVLAQALSMQPAMMMDIVETLAPQHLYYKSTVEILAELNKIKSAGGYKAIKNPKVKIRLNAKHAIIPALRERVIQQGYMLTGTGNIYDQELSQAIQEIQKENNYTVSADLLADSGIWTLFASGVESRIEQVQASLEKLRWLPKQLESNMIFVNTNAAEMKIYENNHVIKSMKTINGRALRRTPMMQSWITQVILNPRWTATDSVILQDKLPEIQKDVNYLKRIRMRLINKSTKQQVDPATLDWRQDARGIAKRFTFVMDPGPKNALGVYKFPLSSDPNSYGSNADAIFMHYTDDPSLFAKQSRQLSSGCVRLAEAKWFAEYLLKNNPQYTPEYINSVLSKGYEGEVVQPDIYVRLPKEEFRSAYLVPLSVEKTESGRIRFMKDSYLHDRRIINAVMQAQNRQDSFAKLDAVVSISSGSLQVLGEQGPSQYMGYATAMKCDDPTETINSRTGMRKLNRRCSTPVKVELNKLKNLEVGRYIVGFENTLYPGFVDIQQAQTTTIRLQKINVPGSLSKEATVKVYRDMGSLIEQKKIYMEEFFAGRSLFRQTIRSYGDFSLAAQGEIDMVTSNSYNYCSEVNMNTVALVKDIREQALFVCESYNQARSMLDLADLYRFNSNGTYQEAAVDYPGDVIPKRYLRLLVGAPLKTNEFVSVMPGVYRIAGNSGKSEVRANAMNVSENYPVAQRRFAKSRLSVINGSELAEGDFADTNSDSMADMNSNSIGQNVQLGAYGTSQAQRCSNASVWRTHLRSYCTQDSQEGCSREQSLVCEDIKLDLRFRK